MYPLLLHTTSCCKHLHCFFLQIWHLASRHVDLFRILEDCLDFREKILWRETAVWIGASILVNECIFCEQCLQIRIWTLPSNSYTSNGKFSSPQKPPHFPFFTPTNQRFPSLQCFFAHFLNFPFSTLQKTERFSEHKSDIFRYVLGHHSKAKN